MRCRVQSASTVTTFHFDGESRIVKATRNLPDRTQSPEIQVDRTSAHAADRARGQRKPRRAASNGTPLNLVPVINGGTRSVKFESSFQAAMRALLM
jgi:hypothetical protein